MRLGGKKSGEGRRGEDGKREEEKGSQGQRQRQKTILLKDDAQNLLYVSGVPAASDACQTGGREPKVLRREDDVRAQVRLRTGVAVRLAEEVFEMPAAALQELPLPHRDTQQVLHVARQRGKPRERLDQLVDEGMDAAPLIRSSSSGGRGSKPG